MIAYCPTSKFRVPAKRSPLRCPGTLAPLEYTDIPPFDPGQIDPTQPGHWRYAAMLPVVEPGQKRITLGEGWTPLIEDEWAGLTVQWKQDFLMPTGSYKDRGVSLMVNWLVGLGATTAVNDSNGNAGASLACYAIRAGLHCCIFVPETASETKKAQITIYGAELAEVPGLRDAATEAAGAATRLEKGTKYASHALHPAYLLGPMTCAWEIWEQLGQRVPDWLVVPTGQGGLLLGAWRGFQHLQNSGLIQKLPRLVAVQAEPYTPIYEAFHKGWDRIEVRGRFENIVADAISISRPVRSVSILAAIRCSGGTALAVSDSEVLQARERLAERGLFVEPTSAVAVAAIHKLKPQVQEGETTVIVLTGHGLKRPHTIT